MKEVRKLALMRMVDGEVESGETEDLAGAGNLPSEESDYVARLTAERALLRAAFPIERLDDAESRRLVDRLFAARQHGGARWRLGGALAASIAAACLIGGGTVLLAERRAEQTNARLLAAFAEDQKLRLAAFAEALDRSLSGQSVAWRNADSGSKGTVTPLRTFQATDGRWCREYRQDLKLLGGHEQITGIACRDAGGWQPMGQHRS